MAYMTDRQHAFIADLYNRSDALLKKQRTLSVDDPQRLMNSGAVNELMRLADDLRLQWRLEAAALAKIESRVNPPETESVTPEEEYATNA